VFCWLYIGEELLKNGIGQIFIGGTPEADNSMNDRDDSIFGIIGVLLRECFEVEGIVDNGVESAPED
jgi:hypothetical protein